jgi:hypothetical protein
MHRYAFLAALVGRREGRKEGRKEGGGKTRKESKEEKERKREGAKVRSIFDCTSMSVTYPHHTTRFRIQRKDNSPDDQNFCNVLHKPRFRLPCSSFHLPFQ